MSRRYTVDLGALLTFADRLAKFNARAEQIASAVDQHIAELHTTWEGDAAAAHLQYHEKWMVAVDEMRDGLDRLRKNAHVAHRNDSRAVQANTTMWP